MIHFQTIYTKINLPFNSIFAQMFWSPFLHFLLSKMKRSSTYFTGKDPVRWLVWNTWQSSWHTGSPLHTLAGTISKKCRKHKIQATWDPPSYTFPYWLVYLCSHNQLTAGLFSNQGVHTPLQSLWFPLMTVKHSTDADTLGCVTDSKENKGKPKFWAIIRLAITSLCTFQNPS